MARRTHRGSGGEKLYAIKDEKGRFEDVQTYERAHGQDVERKSKPEKASKKKASSKKSTKNK